MQRILDPGPGATIHQRHDSSSLSYGFRISCLPAIGDVWGRGREKGGNGGEREEGKIMRGERKRKGGRKKYEGRKGGMRRIEEERDE